MWKSIYADLLPEKKKLLPFWDARKFYLISSSNKRQNNNFFQFSKIWSTIKFIKNHDKKKVFFKKFIMPSVQNYIWKRGSLWLKTKAWIKLWFILLSDINFTLLFNTNYLQPLYTSNLLCTTWVSFCKWSCILLLYLTASTENIIFGLICLNLSNTPWNGKS